MNRPRFAAASIAWPNGDADPQLDTHNIEPLGAIVADLVHLAPAAEAGALDDVDHFLDALQIRRQRTAVAAALGGGLALRRRGVGSTCRRRRRRAEDQGELPRIDTPGALAEAAPAADRR